MKKRVTGKAQWSRYYNGLPILSRDEFFSWSKSNPDFWRLYRLWVQSGYDYKLSPSVNRINADEGYVLGNIEWLTHSLNSSLARHKSEAVLARIYADAAA